MHLKNYQRYFVNKFASYCISNDSEKNEFQIDRNAQEGAIVEAGQSELKPHQVRSMIEELDQDDKIDRRIIYEITGIRLKNEDFDKDFGKDNEQSADPNRPFAKKVSFGNAFWGGFKPGVVEPMIGTEQLIR